MAILYSGHVTMTALLEKIIAIIAPHSCLVCSKESNILCDACLSDAFLPQLSACVFCEKPTIDWHLCATCSRKHKLKSVWVAADYSGIPAELLRLYKFERLKAAHEPLAKTLAMQLPFLQTDCVITPLPTAPDRVRQRGYDQSVLLAKKLASLRGLKYVEFLRRKNSSRQVGANRKTRLSQMQNAYELQNPVEVKGKNVWLLDDICTTGASLSAAAKLLYGAGAKEINAVVVAWQRSKS